MFITIAATVTVICAAVLPAAGEVQRILDDRDNPTRLLDTPTRRTQIPPKAS